MFLKRQKPRTKNRPGLLCYKKRRCPTLPHSRPCSTIGAKELNFRVRNGNGWILFAMTAAKSEVRKQRTEDRSVCACGKSLIGAEESVFVLCYILQSSPKSMGTIFSTPLRGIRSSKRFLQQRSRNRQSI